MTNPDGNIILVLAGPGIRGDAEAVVASHDFVELMAAHVKSGGSIIFGFQPDIAEHLTQMLNLEECTRVFAYVSSAFRGDLFSMSPSFFREYTISTGDTNPTKDRIGVYVDRMRDVMFSHTKMLTGAVWAYGGAGGLDNELERCVTLDFADVTLFLNSDPRFDGDVGAWVSSGKATENGWSVTKIEDFSAPPAEA